MLGHSHTLKSARLRGRQRKIVIGKIIIAVAIVCALWGLIFWSSGLPKFTVQNVEVVGNTSVSSSEIASTTLGFLSGRYYFTIPKANIFFYPKQAIQNHIYDSYPQIEKVSVGFKNFQTIKISIAERQPKALWCQTVVSDVFFKKDEASCFVFDSTGLIFASSTGLESDSPKLIKFFGKLPKENPINQRFISGQRLGELIEFAKNIASLGFEIAEFRDRQDGATEAVLSSGERLIFGSDTDLSLAVANFQVIIEDPALGASNIFSKLDYIDLRFGNKVYYKLKK